MTAQHGSYYKKLEDRKKLDELGLFVDGFDSATRKFHGLTHDIQTDAEFFDLIHPSIGASIRTLEKFIPVIRVLSASVSLLGSLIFATASRKHSTLTRTQKTLASIGILAVSVAGFVFPPLAGTMLVASLSIGLIRESISFFENAYNWYQLHKEYKTLPENLKANQALRNNYQTLLNNMKRKVISNALDIGIDAIAVTGAVLALFFPPVGIGLMLAASALAVAKFAIPKIVSSIQKWYRNNKSLQAKVQTFKRWIKNVFNFQKSLTHSKQKIENPIQAPTSILRDSNTSLKILTSLVFVASVVFAPAANSSKDSSSIDHDISQSVSVIDMIRQDDRESGELKTSDEESDDSEKMSNSEMSNSVCLAHSSLFKQKKVQMDNTSNPIKLSEYLRPSI